MLPDAYKTGQHWSAARSSRWSFPGCIRLEAILRVHLNKPITHHNCSGQTVELTFDSEHHDQLQEAARTVFKVHVSFTGFQ